jgi:dTDP-4-amino-4,6-dideoxygalactose transaminase
VEPDEAMKLPRRRLPPAGRPVHVAAASRARSEGTASAEVLRFLAETLGVTRVGLYASGREATRVALGALAARTSRTEAILPAYTCWSLASAVVAAGLRVRLVDVDGRGWIDREALAALPLERAVCVVVSNLFGVPEPIEPWARAAAQAGCAVVDDAAQSFGADGPEGPIGARGALGILSFARGKPLQALGGGAAVWRDPQLELPSAPGRPLRRGRALLRGLAWNLSLSSRVFPVVARLPFLGVGETRFDPGFRRGGIGGEDVVRCAAALPRFRDESRRRLEIAEGFARDLRARTGLRPLLAPPGWRGVHPRLAVLARDSATRNAALAALEELGAGASGLYPASLDACSELRPHLAAPAACPGARALAERVLTLPTHGRLAGDHWQRALRALERVAPIAT